MRQSVRHWFCVGVAAASSLMLGCGQPSAQEYPVRAVTIVNPFTPGSQPDVAARLIAKKLEERFRQPFVVENRPGAGGNVGAAYVAQSPADGYRLLFSSMSLAVFNPLIYKNMPYKEEELPFVSIAYQAPVILGVSGKSDIQTFDELVGRIRKNPSGYTFGTAGIGTMGHVAGEMLLRMVGAIGVVHVPYKGTAAVIPDMLAGRLTFGFDAPGSYKSLLESGGVRGLVITSDKQLPGFPPIPTIHDVGVPKFQARTWFGWRIRAGTPRPIIDALSKALIEINKDPEVLAHLAAGGATPMENSTPEHSAEFLASEREKWEPYVRASGARVD